MGLWIRSQNKEKFLSIQHNFCIIETIYIWGGIEGMSNRKETRVEMNEIFLGKYKERETALKVLDEIQEFIGKGGLFDEICDSKTSMSENILKSYVYQIPSDDLEVRKENEEQCIE